MRVSRLFLSVLDPEVPLLVAGTHFRAETHLSCFRASRRDSEQNYFFELFIYGIRSQNPQSGFNTPNSQVKPPIPVFLPNSI